MKKGTINNCDRITGGLWHVSGKSGRGVWLSDVTKFWTAWNIFVCFPGCHTPGPLPSLTSFLVPPYHSDLITFKCPGGFLELFSTYHYLLVTSSRSHSQDTSDYQRCASGLDLPSRFQIHESHHLLLFSTLMSNWHSHLTCPALNMELFSPCLLASQSCTSQ